MIAGKYRKTTPSSKEDPMTLSLLMYTLMMTTLVILVGVLVADAVRGRARSSVRRPVEAADPAGRRPAASRDRGYGVAPTRS
jgi:hypothetical protein